MTCFSGLVFGLAPALQSSQVDLNTTLKEGGRSGAEGFRRKRLRELFIVSEFALALLLLIGAGLMIRSFLRLQRVDPGFEPDRVLTAQIVLPQSRLPRSRQGRRVSATTVAAVQALPGVQSASVSMALPPNLLIMRNPFAVEGPAPCAGPVAASRRTTAGQSRLLPHARHSAACGARLHRRGRRGTRRRSSSSTRRWRGSISRSKTR